MGNSYLLRAQLNLAQTKMFQLEQWCRRHVKNSISDFDIDFRVWDDFPKYESLIALLKSQVRLNVHVYEVIVFINYYVF
jgi:hypothetical protein